MSKRLSRVEARVERIIEDGIARIFRGRVDPELIAARLARAVEDSAQPAEDGRRIAPAGYDVALNPADFAALKGATEAIETRLGDELVQIARELGIVLASAPEIRVGEDSNLSQSSIQVTPSNEYAAGLTMQAAPALPAAQQPSGREYLIIDGGKTQFLQQSIVNIGRQLDNHIILDDPEVSRRHAQLRSRFGRWMIYDLGSTAGIRVNGARVSEATLVPGDVIDVAGVQIVFASEESAPHEAARRGGDTRPLYPLA